MTAKSLLSFCLPAVALLAVAVARAATPLPAMTLEEAVIKVQSETGGKILSADPRRLGHRMEYRIKVLTPEGHVRVITISSEIGRAAAPEPTKNPPGNGVGNKERH